MIQTISKKLSVLLILTVMMALPLQSRAQRPRGIEVKDAVDEGILRLRTSRGGALTLEPAVLFPVGNLDKVFDPAAGINLNFDVGITPRVSWVFGVGAFDLKSKINPDMRLKLLPGWMGIRMKYRLPPTVELYWGIAGSAYYEYLTFANDVSAKQIYLAAGGQVSSGLNVWFTKWLTGGFHAKLHFIGEAGRVFPMMEFGLSLGIRG